MTRWSAALIAALLLLAACEPPTPVTTVARDGIPRLGFEKYRLDNGLEVIMLEDHRLPRVAVNLWYHVGAANERPGRSGFAHLFEHMMFEGSRHVGNDQHFRLLEAAGATGINAGTDFDRTNYYQTLPSNQLALALWAESDRMGFLLDTLDQQKLTGQIDVVRNERRQRIENVPYGLINEAVYQQLFPQGHPYHSVVIGSHADLEAAQLDDVRAFFNEFYVPNNASLAIVGDIKMADVRKLVEKYFGPIPAGKPVARPARTPPTRSSEQRVTVADAIDLPQIVMAWQTSTIFDSGDAEADVLAHVLGGGKSSRLYRKLVYDAQLAQDVSASQESLGLSSVFSIRATAKPGVSLQQLETVIDAELTRIQTEGPTEPELARAQAVIETANLRGLEQLDGVADRLNQYNHTINDPDYLRTDIERYRRSSAANVRNWAQRLKRESRVVVQGVPGAKVLNDVPRKQLSATSTAAAAAAVAAVTATAATDWRSQPPGAGAASALQLPVAQHFVLADGLQIYLLENHQWPVLAARLMVLQGGAANPPTLPGLASFSAAMLDEGTTRRPALQLADDLETIGAEFGTGSSSDATSLGIAVLRKHGERAFELLADVALNPSFDDKELKRLRDERLVDYQQGSQDPATVAARAFQAALYGATHPFGQLQIGTPTSLKAVSRERLQQFWRQGFVPGNAALVVSGDISATDLQVLAEKYFGQWTGTVVETPLPATQAAAARQVLIANVPKSPQTVLEIGQIGAPRDSPDYVPLEVMNNVFGGLFSSRINLNLAEAHGYTYGASSGFAWRRGTGPFSMQASVRADATAASVAETFKELTQLRSAPVTSEELALAKDSWIRSLPANFETSSQSVASIASLYVYGLPLDYFATLPAKIGAVNAADVQRVANQYLNPATMTVVAAGDRHTILPALQKLQLGKIEFRNSEGLPAR